MTTISTNITTHHIILPTTKFDVTNETSPTKKKGLFVFNIRAFCADYPSFHSPYKEVIARIAKRIEKMIQTTTITFRCKQAIKINGVIYINLTACVCQRDAEIVVTYSATYERQHTVLTTEAQTILAEYFTDIFVNIYECDLNNIKQAAVINYLQNIVDRIPQVRCRRKMEAAIAA